MPQDRHLTLYHSPRSRSRGARMLLEELGADYAVHAFDLTTGEHRVPEFLAMNPLGKVPTLRHGDVIVTEQVAVYLYAAELYPEAGLSPAVGDPLRGPYLRWMAFYGSCFEPAVVDHSMGRPPAAYSTSPYGDFDTVIAAINAQLAKGPYLLGDRFTAADVLWGAALDWITMFKLMPETPVVRAYIDRILARPAIKRAQTADLALAQAQDEAKAASAAAPHA
ncbi:Glutathione S-transferase GST-6.0 [Ralstonia psammae]|uniref:Glutathione S-transferase GST-6.0 n=1 Tax=Ralstonia psammae TaxID=3058598 RepID=A0ABN9IF22_9RALS|nr:glutathione S-transferase family protein [Ralstonia sp. LMG 19083]CAJ0776526.1 Glutathione S-transferase GST-6.0 [Ralstonia sp. LMG 19083]